MDFQSDQVSIWLSTQQKQQRVMAETSKNRTLQALNLLNILPDIPVLRQEPCMNFVLLE